MENQNYYIWLEFEEWVDEHNSLDCNSDAIVSFEKGGEWAATFFTYTNIYSLVEKNKKSGECLQGKYLWADSMILVDKISRDRIEEIVRHLIESNEFEKIFKLAE